MKLVEKITIANELLKYARECNSAKAHNDNSAFEYYNEIFNKRFKKAKKWIIVLITLCQVQTK